MKKTCVLSVLLVSLLMILSCKSSCDYEEEVVKSVVLPNGYSLSVEEQIELKQFAIKNGFIDNSGRAAKEEYTDNDIEQMIQMLLSEYGDVAKNYFGETKVTVDQEEKSEKNNARSSEGKLKNSSSYATYGCTIPLTSDYSKYYTAKYEIDGTCYWGLWWIQFKDVTAECKVYRQGMSGGSIGSLEISKMTWTYEDSYTKQKSGCTDWEAIKRQKPKDAYEELQQAIQLANRNVMVTGTKHTGWLPSIKEAKFNATVEHPWIVNGKHYCIGGIKDVG